MSSRRMWGGSARAPAGGEAAAPLAAGASRLRRALAGVLLAAAAGGLAPARAGADEADAPFAVQRLEGAGRPVEVVAAPRAGGRGADVVVVFVTGTPPDEQRRLDVFRAGAGDRPVLDPRLRLPVPPWAVAFDVADVDPSPGPELLLLGPERIEIRTLAGEGAALRAVALDPPAPLPPRVRGLSRMPLVPEGWGDGVAEALVPTLAGARRVPLQGRDGSAGAGSELAMPLLTEYFTPTPGPPPYDGLLETTFEWPRVVPGRDAAGSPGPDLFALGRYGVSVFRRGPGGLPAVPTRHMPLRPFDAAEELRHETTRVRLWARDLDGDGLTDLVVHRSSGRLLGSHADTAVHANPGGGADLARPAAARVSVESGVAEVELADLDGDGRVELVHSVVRFGLVQLLRILARRQVEVELRVYALAPPGIRAARETWHGEVSLALDFDEGRVAGLLPSVGGDWNGDGRRDLLYGLGRRGLAVHLGAPGDAGPGFRSRVASQALPEGSASWLRVLDADGDGLDDLVVFDDWSRDAGVHLLRNRGTLPGGPPALRPAAAAAAP